MDNIRIRLEMAWSGKQRDVQLPVTMPIHRILTALTERLELPEGEYSLRLESVSTALETNSTFADLGISEGAQVILERIKPLSARRVRDREKPSAEDLPGAIIRNTVIGALILAISILIGFYWVYNENPALDDLAPLIIFPILVGALVVYLLFRMTGDWGIYRISSRDVPIIVIGILAATITYSSITTNILHFYNVSYFYLLVIPMGLRLIVPMFFGLTAGPAVGFLVGACSQLLNGFLRSGSIEAPLISGTDPLMMIGAGLIGMIAGLARMRDEDDTKHPRHSGIFLWTPVVLLAIAALISMESPEIRDPWRGDIAYVEPLFVIIALSLGLFLLLALRPASWPYVLLGFAIIMVLVGIMRELRSPAWIAAFAAGSLALYLRQGSRFMGSWVDEDDTASVVVASGFGLTVGSLFTVILSITLSDFLYWHIGDGFEFAYSFFVTAVPISLAVVIVFLPGLYAVWKRAVQN